jgi:hypothetical protein
MCTKCLLNAHAPGTCPAAADAARYEMQGVASEPKLSPHHTANRWPTHPLAPAQQPLMLLFDMQGVASKSKPSNFIKQNHWPTHPPGTCQQPLMLL